jgi:hypothetical protein
MKGSSDLCSQITGGAENAALYTQTFPAPVKEVDLSFEPVLLEYL